MPDSSQNKTYQRKRNWLALYGLLLSFAILLSVVAFRLTFLFYDGAARITSSAYGIVFFYFLFFSIYSLVFSLPLSFYSGFVLEHQYELSNQTPAGWFWEWTKKQLLSFAIVTPLVLLLYTLIWHFESTWWLWAWAGYAVFSLVLGKLFPVLIIPLFYKYSPIADQVLKAKIEALAGRFDLQIENVYSLNLSKTTKKANAAFTGFGKTKRVILGDTLLDSFTHDEIESVVAHELGHYKNKDIWKQFGFGVAFSFVGFWLAFRMLGASAEAFGYGGAEDIRSFPLLCLIFYIFGLLMSPASNAFSRRAERRADQFSLDTMKNQNSFISAMEKLSTLNLADPNPHPVIEFLLYDHPAIGKRIRMAERHASSKAG